MELPVPCVKIRQLGGTGVILSSVSVEESDTRAGLLVLSAATFAYGGMQVEAFVRWVSLQLSSSLQPTTTTLSFQTPLHAPSWGDVSGSFAMSQSSIGCFLYSVGLSYCTLFNKHLPF
jgi:hypothetical protein